MAAIPDEQAPQYGASILAPTQGHGVFSVSCSTLINAAPLKCIEAVLNTADYHKWNTLCPSARIEKQPSTPPTELGIAPELVQLAARSGFLYPGVHFEVDVALKEGAATRKQAEEVNILERFERDGRTGYRVAWIVRGRSSMILRGERVQEFVETEDGKGTQYYCWETFGGLLAYIIWLVAASQVADGFGRWMYGLKKFVEEV